jgi:aspartate beta-hydroxylase
MSRVMRFLLTSLNKTDRLCHPLQSGCPNIIPGLRAQPFWDSVEFPWVERLEAACGTIVEEFHAMKDKGHFFQVSESVSQSAL